MKKLIQFKNIVKSFAGTANARRGGEDQHPRPQDRRISALLLGDAGGRCGQAGRVAYLYR